jgi:L-fucose mutarotase/ribose pyranase (RbsD/FucU family)
MTKLQTIASFSLIGLVIVFSPNVARSDIFGYGDWKKALPRSIPYLGHRNWIVIVDSAYPDQTSEGIRVEHTDEINQLDVVKTVLDELAKHNHVRPKIYLDAELPFVPEKRAPAIDKYRDGLKKLLADHKVESLPHERIIDKLDKAGEKFKVLILKTNLTLPYTSVFIELDCGYWSDEAEKELRKAMADAEKK